MTNSLQPHGLYSAWNSPGKNTGVGSLSLLQGIFPTQELNPGLPHCRRILYCLSHQGSPRILEWVAYPFSRGFPQPRNRLRRRQWQPTPVLLPGKSHGQRSLVGGSPWGREELDTTEWLHFHFSLSCIGEGNGNPLQCSCLENPRDGGGWWASIYGVAQSRTRLKRLSSSFYLTLMATHSSILAWKIRWMQGLGGLQSTGHKESDTTERLHFHFLPNFVSRMAQYQLAWLHFVFQWLSSQGKLCYPTTWTGFQHSPAY